MNQTSLSACTVVEPSILYLWIQTVMGHYDTNNI